MNPFKRDMLLAFAIFIMAFTATTGMIVIGLLTLHIPKPMHFYGAVATGAVIGLDISEMLDRQIKAG